jgi:protein O-GlcNAc transferase
MTFLFNQALQAHQSGKTAEAEALYRKIISADPKHFDAFHMLGIICSANGKHQDADQFFRAALSIDSRFPPCHLNYGFFLLKQRRPDQAIASFDKALAIFPKFAEAYLGRGNALRDLEQYADAMQAYNQAVALKPNLAEAHAGIGNMLARLQRLNEAITAYDKALALKPDLEFVAGERISCKTRLCDWNDLSSDYQRLLAPAKGERIDSQPFDFLCAPSSARQQLDCAKFWISKKHPASDQPIWQGEIYKHDKINVAYISSDFRPHPVSHLIAGLIEKHTKAQFRVTGISLQPEDSSETGQRMKHAFDNFIDVSKIADQKIAELIRELEIDIAIDLNGFTRDARTNIFARRPAPIQVNYLGYPGTMGAPYIDYMIADQIALPVHQQEFYSEKIVYMPNSFQANDRERSISEKIFTRTELGLPPDSFVFCCFNNSYKINPDVFDIWMRILNQVNDSVLWLVANNKAVEDNLRTEAAARNVNGDRLVFAPRIPYPEHLARLSSADLFLDTAPFNAGTTASDALWAKLPVLTRICDGFSGRMAASLLTAIDLSELITSTPQAYESLAIELAKNPERLAGVKQKLSQNRLTKPLFDTQLFTRHIEKAYTAVYERYQASLPPDHIYVAK